MKILLTSIFFIAASCASPGTSELKVTQDVTVKSEGQPDKSIKANETIEINSKPVILEKEGYISMAVYPINDSEARSNLTASLAKVEDWGGPSYQKAIQKEVQNAVDQISEVQGLLSQRKATNALEKITEIEKKFPITSVKILKANCYVLLGDQSRAAEVLEDILKEQPDHKTAKQMLIEIKGKG